MSKKIVHFRLNGEPVEVAVKPGRTLVQVLREDLGYTGTKRACNSGACSACSVLVDGGAVNAPTAKEIFGELFERGGSPAEIVREKGLSQVTDSGAIESMVDEAVRANPKSVADYRQGKRAAAKFLVGQVMKLSRGKANPRLVNEILTRKLESDGAAS